MHILKLLFSVNSINIFNIIYYLYCKLSQYSNFKFILGLNYLIYL